MSYNDMVNGNPLDLPRLPIPKLEDTVSRYLQVSRHGLCVYLPCYKGCCCCIAKEQSFAWSTRGTLCQWGRFGGHGSIHQSMRWHGDGYDK